jgi:outer membrane protein assembly factor BamE (lipoprotein component of BamABCDE complex)
MTQAELISVELQKFIDIEFDKLKREVEEAFEKLRAKQAAEAALAETKKSTH